MCPCFAFLFLAWLMMCLCVMSCNAHVHLVLSDNIMPVDKQTMCLKAACTNTVGSVNTLSGLKTWRHCAPHICQCRSERRGLHIQDIVGEDCYFRPVSGFHINTHPVTSNQATATLFPNSEHVNNSNRPARQSHDLQLY